MTSIFSNLPNNLIFEICKQNKINKQNEMYKKRFGIAIKQLEVYQEEYQNYEEDSMVEHIDLWKDGNKRCDCRFLDYNDLWNTSYHEWIVEDYSVLEDIDFDQWCDENF